MDAAARIEAEIQTEWGRSGSAAIDLLLRRGNEALEAGEAVTAAEHFTAAIDHDPTLAAAWAGRAAAYYAAGQFGPALDDLRQTLVLEPRHFDALRGFGALLEEMQRPEEALEVYRQVLALYPADPVASDAALRLEKQLNGQTL